jgi:NUMOD4 motif.
MQTSNVTADKAFQGINLEWRMKQGGGMRVARGVIFIFFIMREIPGFPNYLVTEDGKVFSRFTNKFIKQKTDIHGYKSVALYTKNRRDICVHRLVMWAYVGVQEDGFEVRHKNGIRSDNRLSNLEYGTRSENAIDRVTHGNNYQSKGERNGKSKLTLPEVEEIRKRIANGDKPIDIARDYDVVKGTIYHIKNNTYWRL